MATSNKIEAETVVEVPAVEVEMEPETASKKPKVSEKDAEIARLKAELEKANRRAAYQSPADERARIRQMANEAAKNGENPWDITVEVRVPRRPAGEDPFYWISVNNRTAQIPANDKLQEMRLPFALTMVESLAWEDVARNYADSLQVYDPVTNPHPNK